jgi:oligogalacturonide transporter
VPNVAQSAHTLTWMKILFFLAPGVLILLGLFFGSRFRITPATHAVLKSELERLRSGGSRKDASPEAREICELLSGIEYTRLYPANKK